MTDDNITNLPQDKKEKSFDELFGSAIQQQKQAFQDEYKKKASELAKKRLEANKVIKSVDAEFEQLKADYADGLVNFKNV